MSIYALNIPIKHGIDQARLYGMFTQRFSRKKDAISRINSWMSCATRNEMKGIFKTELITAVHYDEIVYFATIIKL